MPEINNRQNVCVCVRERMGEQASARERGSPFELLA